MSDEIDKKFDIWNDVFLDHVNIHCRGGRKKGPNRYGPVLFVLDVDILLSLPAGTEIFVARRNPIYWKEWEEPDEEWWFRRKEDLEGQIRFGEFDKMLIIRTPSGTVDFPARRVSIMLDDPQRALSNGASAYDHAQARLMAAARTGRIKASISNHGCQPGCICVDQYAQCSRNDIDFFFE